MKTPPSWCDKQVGSQDVSQLSVSLPSLFSNTVVVVDCPLPQVGVETVNSDNKAPLWVKNLWQGQKRKLSDVGLKGICSEDSLNLNWKIGNG